ncbi:hypothetical protein EW146_g9189 [Bondarzewia mesenterica]|uniref:Uncharacterized protein n=1 Tax=Bondarzewia mesenterica TaxID=1095465 RepID=A0A4S4L9V9_9AGAM|nr:hypothetical protein EW146_g9189 [Bondarzewia mesenterica]
MNNNASEFKCLKGLRLYAKREGRVLSVMCRSCLYRDSLLDQTCKQKTNNFPILIVVILPEGGNDIYSAVKPFGDVTMQYYANVVLNLKLNFKLGDINTIPDAKSASILYDPSNPTIVMGKSPNSFALLRTTPNMMPDRFTWTFLELESDNSFTTMLLLDIDLYVFIAADALFLPSFPA